MRLSRGDEEKVQLLVEANCSGAAVAKAVALVRREVAAAHGVSLAKVTVVLPRTVPKTTSGKIARKRCQAALDDNSLQ